ncbi:hypothetical protein [Sorangium sp. So ce388]
MRGGPQFLRPTKIGDPELRRTFLEDIREHALTLELARAWLGEA